MYVLGIGITWTILQLWFIQVKHVPLNFENNLLVYGLLAGTLLAASNIFLIESLTHIDVGLGSTVYRLNTIGVVFLSFLVLHETIGTLKLFGIVLGICAVLLLNKNGNTADQAKKAQIYFWLVVCASFCRALYGIVAKSGLSAHVEPQLILLLAALCWIVGGAFYARVVEKKFTITKKKIAYSLLSGFLVFCIVNFLMLGLEIGQASIIIPIANMSFIIALLISLALKMEKISKRKLVATMLAVFSIILLSFF